MDPEIEKVISSNSASNKVIDFTGLLSEGINVDETRIEEGLNELVGTQSASIQKQDLYQLHLASIYSWFLRSSFGIKLKFLYRMLKKLKDESHLDIILLSLNFRMDKLRIYSRSLPITNYIYDIKLNDHNRGLEKIFLEETFNMDILWFESLEPQQQTETLVDILKCAGGALVDKFYELAVKLKEKRNPKQKKEEDLDDIPNTNSLFSNKFMSQQEVYKDPSVIEIEKRRKTLIDALTKYTNQIMGITEKAKSPRPKKDNRNRKKTRGEKSPKPSPKKTDKDSKISMLSLRNKERKPMNEINVIDQIQELPIWIVKKIFNYLDHKTLKKLETVNSYWAYVIDDMVKERNCRKHMDKVIKKMEMNISFKQSDLNYKQERKSHKMSIYQKRMKELAGRGAIHPKLRTTNNSKVVHPTLLEKATREGASNLVMPIQGYESFPRNVPNNQILLMTPTCVLNELGKQPYQFQDNIRNKTNVDIRKSVASVSELSDEGQKYLRRRLSI